EPARDPGRVLALRRHRPAHLDRARTLRRAGRDRAGARPLAGAGAQQRPRRQPALSATARNSAFDRTYQRSEASPPIPRGAPMHTTIRRLSLLGSLFVVCVAASTARAQTITATAPTGPVVGVTTPTMHSFLGIPYAAPPV